MRSEIGGLETQRVVLLRYTLDGGWRRGSGLRIGETLVLTADHCARGTDHMVVTEGHDYPAAVRWRSGRADVDLAVLEVPDVPPLPVLSCARVNTGIAARIENCVALGFPKWNDRNDTKHRVQADGYIATGEGADPHAVVGTAESLSFKITAPAIRDRQVEAGDLDTETTPWGGMSGAVIVTRGGQILGVVRGHALAAGVGSLTFTPLAAVDALPEQTAAGFWGHLGVTEPHALPVLPVPEMAGSPGIVVGQIPAHPPGYVHRGVVDRLADRLDEASMAVVCALTGMRGVGKTQVAAAYARSWIEAGRGLVGWVNAESVDVAVGDLARIAEAVGVADPEGDSARSARRLVDHLATRAGESLLVFDNATDPDALRPYLPTIGRTRVVITTTHAAFTEFGDVVDLEQFARAESLQYLAERTGIDDAFGAALLADGLGDLPLALAAAASTIRQRRYRDFSRYLDQLRAYPIEQVLHRPAGQDYQRSTAAALMLSIDTLAHDDPSGMASRLTGIMSVLSPDGVRIDVLRAIDAARGADPGAYLVDEAIERCTQHSLLSWSVLEDALIMHRLTARVLREHAARNGTLAEVIVDALTLLKSQLFDESNAWARRELGAHLAAQIEALWESVNAEELATDIVIKAMDMRAWAVAQLRAAADLTRAIDIGRRALGDSEHILGADNRLTRILCSQLAGTYKAAGRLDQAIPLFKRDLEDSQRILGPDHRDTLSAQHNLAQSYESAGRLDQAIPLFERDLEDRQRILGPDHRDTLSTRHNLAHCYASAGRLDDAIPLYERNLEDSERVLGRDDPDTLTARYNLARAYQEVGRRNEAVTRFERSVAERERVLGADDPDTLTSRLGLAGAYQSVGRLDEAIALFERTLTDYERLLGLDNPWTLTARNNLAFAYDSAGRLDKAIPLFERTLAERERVIGADHPGTLVSWLNLAGAYLSAGRQGEAIPIFERALADYERLLSADHPQILAVRNNLAFAYDSAGRLDEAIPLYERTLAERERVLGADHPDTLGSRINLGYAYRLAGHLEEAIPIFERALADHERVVGAEDPQTLAARDTLAYAYLSAGRLGEAIPLYERALAEHERIRGLEHPDTVAVCNDLAGAYLSAGRPGEAIPLYERALAERERILGPDHPDTLTVRNNLAVAYGRAGRLDEAIALFERTLTSRERVLGTDHPDTVASRNDLAKVYQSAGRLDNAIRPDEGTDC